MTFRMIIDMHEMRAWLQVMELERLWDVLQISSCMVYLTGAAYQNEMRDLACDEIMRRAWNA